MTDFEQLLDDVKDQYYRLILVNDNDSEKYKLCCKEHDIPVINLSAKFSELLEGLSEDERAMEAWDKLKAWMISLEKPILAFDEVDYLFSPEVGILDPIKNFCYYSRNRQVIILFMRAKKKNNLLTYSEEGNEDYMAMDVSLIEGFLIGW